jgi:hypothetical protein
VFTQSYAEPGIAVYGAEDIAFKIYAAQPFLVGLYLQEVAGKL